MMKVAYTRISKTFQKNCFKEFLARLPAPLADRVARFQRWTDAQASLLGKLLLCETLGGGDASLLSILEYSKFGKPFISGFPNFNISHSGNYVVFATGDVDKVGIDVEEMKDQNFEDFRMQMTAGEWNTICSADNRQIAFYTYWTKKEAIIKAHGSGLSIPLTSFEIERGKTIIEGQAFFVAPIALESGYLCQLASDHPIIQVPTPVECLFSI